MKAYKQNWKDFTVVPNEIFRHGLSLKAIGLYGYIVNKPDGWDFSIAGISSQTNDGKDSIRTATHELEEKGFLQRSRERKSDGQYGDGIWLVFDKPSENPTSVNPTPGASRLSNTKDSKTRERGLSHSDLVFSSKEIEEMTSQYEVTEKALIRVGKKYRLFCSENGRKMTKDGFRLWITREKWEEDDYSPEHMIKEVMKGF